MNKFNLKGVILKLERDTLIQIFIEIERHNSNCVSIQEIYPSNRPSAYYIGSPFEKSIAISKDSRNLIKIDFILNSKIGNTWINPTIS